MSLQETIEETKAGLAEIFEDGLPEDYDFSYITEELLATYESEAQEKDPAVLEEDMLGFPEEMSRLQQQNWCFYGHHLVKKGTWWHWQNGNPKNGCDARHHTCKPGHFWKYQITKSAPIKCANHFRNPAFSGN